MALIKWLDVPSQVEKKDLISRAYKLEMEYHDKQNLMQEINTCFDYTEYQRLDHFIESRELGINETASPSYGQIWKHILKINNNNSKIVAQRKVP